MALYSFRRLELSSTELQGLFTLILGRREDDGIAAHFRCELNGKMAETGNSHDTQTFIGLTVLD